MNNSFKEKIWDRSRSLGGAGGDPWIHRSSGGEENNPWSGSDQC